MRGYVIPFTSIPTQSHEPCARSISSEEQVTIDNLVTRLIGIGAVTRCEERRDQYISSIFTVPKSNGDNRLVINLKPLNTFIEVEHFKMEDWRTVTSVLEKDVFMAKFDLKDAYHFISISMECRKFLRFRWNGFVYEYTCLPFGLSTGPFIFTKVMKEAMKVLRMKGLLSVIYLDDGIVFGNTFNECKRNIVQTCEHLRSLGFKISEKSDMNPSQRIEFLGLVFDSKQMTVSLPDRKKVAIRELGTRLVKGERTTIQKVAEYVGTLVAASPGVNCGKLFTRDLEVDKQQALGLNGDNYKCVMKISLAAKEDIHTFIKNLNEPNVIRNDVYDTVMFSDSSLESWGCHSEGQSIGNNWNIDEKGKHINVLELMAVENGLKYFFAERNQINILLRVDNTSAVSYINKYGGCRSAELHSIAKRIHLWCMVRTIRLTAAYISSKENIIADRISRSSDYNSEWQLGRKYFERICATFGKPEIDLFASAGNAQCERYYSYSSDVMSEGVDAFSFQWNEFSYAFPPFALLPRVLKKVKVSKGKVIVVAPKWEGQPWYPVYKALCVSSILRCGPDKKLLVCPNSRANHPMKTLELMAAVLCGQRSD